MVVQQPVQVQQPMAVQSQVVQQVPMQPVTQQPVQQVVTSPVKVTTLRDWKRPLFGSNCFGDCIYSTFCLCCVASGLGRELDMKSDIDNH